MIALCTQGGCRRQLQVFAFAERLTQIAWKFLQQLP